MNDLSAQSLIQPKEPRAAGWVRMPPLPTWVTLGFAGVMWEQPHYGIRVISAVEVAKDADGIDRGPEYHISISKTNGRRCPMQDAQQVLVQFDLAGAEEDNHVPHGIVRNFWRPVADRFVGMECACKADEPAIREDKGDYVWRPA